MEKNLRWYDEYGLGDYLKKLESLMKHDRDMVLVGIKNILSDRCPDIIVNNILDFPIRDRKRWYDEDPLSWVVINALKYVEKDVLNRVIDYLKEGM